MIASTSKANESASRTENERVVLTEFGGADKLSVVREALPTPKRGQIRVRVEAAGAEFTDTLIRAGNYPDLLWKRPPFSPGYDVVGTVDAIGPGVEGFRVGDRAADMTVTGGYARYVCLDAHRAVKAPPAVDPAEAVSLILSYVTAYQVLHRAARVKKGASVLVVGAGGAVGSALCQLGRLHSLRMIGTARAADHDRLRELGVTPIDYSKPDAWKRVRSAALEGYDAVLDPIGEDGFAPSFASVKKGGTLVAYGFRDLSRGRWLRVGALLVRLKLWNLLPNGKRARFYSITDERRRSPEAFRTDLATLFQWLESGAIRPTIEARLPLSGAAEAHRRLERGGVGGKLVLVPSLA